MIRIVAFGTFFTAMALVVATQATSESQPDHGRFMRAKLEHAQKVLEGLTTNDMDLVAEHAEQMSDLSEQAPWQVIKTEKYFQHSLEFRRAADALAEAGDENNIDAASLAYVDVTLKCISCHKYVRDVRVAQIVEPDLQIAHRNP